MSFTSRYILPDPVAEPGLIESMLKELEGKYEFAEPDQTAEKDIRRIHTQFHIEPIKRENLIHEIACLATGGIIKAAQVAVESKPSFGLIKNTVSSCKQGSLLGILLL